MGFFAKIRPQDDILPVRAAYGPTQDNTTIGLNPLWSDVPLWVAGPDLVDSVLLSGRIPEVLDAVRFVPVGQQEELTPVALRGQVQIDPTEVDFFRRVIEERQLARRRPDLAAAERERLQRFLKVLGNSASYGIYAELNPQPTVHGGPETVGVYGLEEMFKSTTRSPEEPGEFCFPPFAALTTAAARLMLGLLERCVRDVGGEIAFGDTDSGAVVATQDGGLVPCCGGTERLPDGTEAIRALSWAQVEALSERFRVLSPYDRDIVPGSILKIEDVNRDPETGAFRQLHAFAISAKRYALFLRHADGRIEVVEAKEHGLGHLLNPMDLKQEDRGWIKQVWTALIQEALGQPLRLPRWADRPALVRVSVSTTHLFATFRDFNRNKTYADGVKPMNFGLSPIVAKFGHPAGVDPQRFHLLGSYEKDPTAWLEMVWYDKYSGEVYRIGIGRDTPGDRVQVKSYRDIILEYRVHPEPKSLDSSGVPCHPGSRGLLSRRPVQVGSITFIGKESNAFEQVAQGLVHSRAEVQPTYHPPQLAAWDLVFLPAIRLITLERLVAATGLGSRAIRYLWKGQRRPSPATEAVFRAEARRWAQEAVRTQDLSPEDREVAVRVLIAAPVPSEATSKARKPKKRRK